MSAKTGVDLILDHIKRKVYVTPDYRGDDDEAILADEIARLRAALDNQIDTISGLGASLLERDAEIARLHTEVELLTKELEHREEKWQNAEDVADVAQTLEPHLRVLRLHAVTRDACEAMDTFHKVLAAYRERA